MMIYAKGHWQRWTRAATPPGSAAWPGPRLGVVWDPGGSPQPLLLATSVFLQNRNFWVFSENCWFSEILYLDSPFSAEF
jgi:hypothetical protein